MVRITIDSSRQVCSIRVMAAPPPIDLVSEMVLVSLLVLVLVIGMRGVAEQNCN